MLASCSAAPHEGEDSAPPRSIIILSAAAGPGDFPGPIQGEAPCGDENMPPLPPCLTEDLTLAEAVLACGPTEATIDRGASHFKLVKFPARLSERFPSMPTDLDIVRCVRSRVGFSFSAGLATGSEESPFGDPAPFRALHSKPAEKQGT